MNPATKRSRLPAPLGPSGRGGPSRSTSRAPRRWRCYSADRPGSRARGGRESKASPRPSEIVRSSRRRQMPDRSSWIVFIVGGWSAVSEDFAWLWFDPGVMKEKESLAGKAQLLAKNGHPHATWDLVDCRVCVHPTQTSIITS